MSDNENYEIDEQEELDTGAEYTEGEEISDEQFAEIREEARKKAYYEDDALTWNDIKQHLAAWVTKKPFFTEKAILRMFCAGVLLEFLPNLFIR